MHLLIKRQDLIMLNKRQRNRLALSCFFLLFTFRIGSAAITDSFVAEVSKTRNLVALFEQKTKLVGKFKKKDSLTRAIEDGICRHIRAQHYEVLQSKSKLGAMPSIGEFIGALFFPHPCFANTLKTNFNQLSFFERSLILISADFGFKFAKNIIILANNEKVNLSTFSTNQDLLQLLSIPFAAENGMVIRKAKEILNNDTKQNDFYANIEREFTTTSILTTEQCTILLNAGYIYKFLGRPELSINLFRRASEHESNRGTIEYGFMILERDLTKEDEFIGRSKPLGIEAYALWKLAQYHRYGISTPRDLVRANEYYLASLLRNELNKFPEIYYDAGDFAEYFAYSQTNPDKRLRALKQALDHYSKAAEGGIDEGYSKQIEILKKISDLENVDDLQGRIASIASHAAQRSFVHAKNLLKASGLSIDGRIEFLNLEQCVGNYTNYLKAVLREGSKCPSF